MNNESKTISVTYINSFDEDFSIQLSLHNQLENLMEVIRDNNYENWGDCGGQACCCSCHVSIDRDTRDAIFEDEEQALSLLSNRTESSRLACQIDIEENLDGAILRYLGNN